VNQSSGEDIMMMVLLVLVVLAAVVIAWLIASLRRVKKLIAIFRRLIKGNTGNLEEMFSRLVNELENVREEQAVFKQSMDEIRRLLETSAVTPAMMRYNAFEDAGSDLSFSIAILDRQKNGVILSSLYGRHESRTYAKPVIHGESPYPLTEEEILVMQKALANEDDSIR
jgi:hypothetical protein